MRPPQAECVCNKHACDESVDKSVEPPELFFRVFDEAIVRQESCSKKHEQAQQTRKDSTDERAI